MSLPSNIKGVPDGSTGNGRIAYIITHVHRFAVLCNNGCNNYCAHPVQQVLETRVAKKEEEGSCVQHGYCVYI